MFIHTEKHRKVWILRVVLEGSNAKMPPVQNAHLRHDVDQSPYHLSQSTGVNISPASAVPVCGRYIP